ncbi:RraA family protein [Novispirillum sp. DQ9]|uniref:RraA family protein n=1 Tax=Novispirillum sp. DQ9 TaxID=3398612 RepID=UPI003C7B8C96
MAVQLRRTQFRTLSEAELAAWRDIPAAVASDVQNRSHSLTGGIQALRPEWRICGQARTVAPTPGDNACVHLACSIARPGEVVVVAANGDTSVAMLGEMITRQAVLRNLGGLVVDGAVRDVGAIRSFAMPVFARCAVPRGPHKDYGGIVDTPVSLGGVAVRPGDLILGDDDGVVVVPLDRAEALLPLAQAHMAKEQAWVEALESGRTLVEVFGVAEPEVID